MEQENIASTDAQQPVASVKKFSWIILIIIFVIAVLLSSAGTYYFLSQKNQNQNPVNLQITSQSKSGNENIQPTSLVSENTAGIEGWKTYSSQCGFSLQYPKEWIAQNYFMTDSKNTCLYLSAPDLKQGVDSREGFYLTIIRTEKGSVSNSITINSLEDYIKANESMSYPLQEAKNKQQKTVASFAGIQFEPFGQESHEAFIFLKDNYIYEISWPTAYSSELKVGYKGIYSSNLDQILSTFRFTNQTTSENTFNPAELSGFPIYPNAQFISKQDSGACEKGKITGYTVCNAITYTFETKDDFDQARNWYFNPINNLAKAGFVLTQGGAGMYTSPRDAYGGVYRYKKDNKNYDFDMRGEATKTTFYFSVQTSPMPSGY